MNYGILMPRRFQVELVNRINNCCPSYVKKRMPSSNTQNQNIYYKRRAILKRGALGYTRNRKTASKIGQNRKLHTKLYTQIGPNRNKK